jgi:(1->4)-alpha-D-glucan 1-alpha-D-glucosylmutase
MMVGAWPPELAAEDRDACGAFADRLAQWQEKALREAKLATDWAAPNEPYEAAARDFLYELVADRPSTGLIYEIAAFAHQLAPAGAVNGLTQALIKLTAPGVPDIYQGTEFWDFSLVDPDNRRPVDFAARTEALASTASFAELAKSWRDGRIKQRVMRCALAVRRASPLLFAEGDYAAVRVVGPLADHVVAYARQHDEVIAVTVATRLAGRLLGADDRIAVAEQLWGDTTIHLPAGMPQAGWHEALGSDRLPDRDGGILVSEILRDAPVALLVSGAGQTAASDC